MLLRFLGKWRWAGMNEPMNEVVEKEAVDWAVMWVRGGMLCILDDVGDGPLTAEQEAKIADHVRAGHARLSGSPLLTAEQAASYLSVPLSFIRSETRAGRLKSTNLGARYRRYSIAQLDRYATRGR
jgi:excisionase family DNA binding protein